MNPQIEKIAADARGQMTVLTTVDDSQWQEEQEFLEKFAKLLIQECVTVIDGMKFTDEGPSDMARYQRTLCGTTIKEYFGLISKGPVTSRNVP